MNTKAIPKINETKLTNTQEILNPYFSERKPPIIGPQKSPILIAKLYIADDISFGYTSFNIESFSLSILHTSIITGTLTEAPDAPIKDNPNTIELVFCGKKLKGYTKETPIKINTRPLHIVFINPIIFFMNYFFNVVIIIFWQNHK